MAQKKVTPVQLQALIALNPGAMHNPDHRPRNSLERLRKKGLVSGSKQRGWEITEAGKTYLRKEGRC